MNLKKTERFVLLIHHDSDRVRKTALDLAGEDGYVLIARSATAAVELAKRYKPSHAVVAESSASLDGKALPTLLAEFSPDTEIVLVSEEQVGRNIKAEGQTA